MKVIDNIISKIKKEGNSSAIIFSHKNIEVQLNTIEYTVKRLLDIPNYKHYKTHPDCFGIWPEHIDKNSIKIEQIHEFIRKTQLKPFCSKFKVGIIVSAEKMTEESQNALLKTLEEPPKNTFIIITTKNKNALLETIISRCQIIELKEVKEEPINIEEIINSDINTRFKYVENLLKNKKNLTYYENIETILEGLLVCYRKKLLKKDKSKQNKFLDIINLIESTKKAIESNVNQRLALENLMINLPLKGIDY